MRDGLGRLARELFLNLIKPVTINYPSAKLEKEYHPELEDIRGKHKFIEDKCIGCGACREICSSGAITLSESNFKRIILVELARCIFCGRCRDICPEKGLEFFVESESSQENNSGEKFTKIEHSIDLLRCEGCGKPSFPIKQIHLIKKNVIEKLQQSTKETAIKDMEIYMRYCPDCRRIYSYLLRTHPRKSY